MTMPEPGWDPAIGSYIIKTEGPWIVSVTPMIFNDRIMLTHIDEYPHTASAGYCYEKGSAAGLAAHAWSVLHQPCPVGYKKIAFGDQEDST